MNVAALLEHSRFFSGISPASRAALAGICRPRELAKGETLFLEGHEGEAFFILVNGAVRLVKTSPEGGEVVLKVVKPGETFAEVILFESPRYPATATALGVSLVLAMARADFQRLLSAEDFRNDFIAMLMRKQRYLAEKISLLSSHSVEERFFHFLREQYGEATEVTVGITKKDLAAAIGVTPETLSRLLASLAKRKILTWKGRTIRR